MPHRDGNKGSQHLPTDPTPEHQTLLDEHVRLLETHKTLLLSIRDGSKVGDAAQSIADACLNNTQGMLQNVTKLRTAFNDGSRRLMMDHSPSTKRRRESRSHDQSMSDGIEAVSKLSKRLRLSEESRDSKLAASEPHNDVSDLFTIDTNPTPVEHLVSSNNGHANAPGDEQGRSRGLGTTLPTNTLGVDIDDNDSFIARAAAEHDTVEARRRRKEDKKRKRDSGPSLGDYASGNVRPGIKRRKKEPKTSTKTPKPKPPGKSRSERRKAKPQNGGNQPNTNGHQQQDNLSKKRKKK